MKLIRLSEKAHKLLKIMAARKELSMTDLLDEIIFAALQSGGEALQPADTALQSSGGEKDE